MHLLDDRVALKDGAKRGLSDRRRADYIGVVPSVPVGEVVEKVSLLNLACHQADFRD
jgi:hypothetical protein